jgi:hypothetical protein
MSGESAPIKPAGLDGCLMGVNNPNIFVIAKVAKSDQNAGPSLSRVVKFWTLGFSLVIAKMSGESAPIKPAGLILRNGATPGHRLLR